MVVDSRADFIYDSYEQSSEYNIEEIISLLKRYLPDWLETKTEIKNITDLKRVLLRNKQEILKNIIDTNIELLYDFKYSHYTVREAFWTEVNSTKIMALKSTLHLHISDNDFVKLCLSIYKIANWKENEKQAIIEDYKNETSKQITRIISKLQEKKLSKDVQRRYNSREILNALRFVNILLPEDKQKKFWEIEDLDSFIWENNDILLKRLKNKNISLEDLYKIYTLLKFLKREFPNTAKEMYLTDELIWNIDNYIPFDKIIEEYKETIKKDLIDKWYKEEEINDTFIKSYFDKRLWKDLDQLKKEPKNELSKLDKFVTDWKMSLDFYNQVLDLVNSSSIKLDIDKFIDLIFFIDEENLSIFINQFWDKNKVIKLINNDIEVLFDKLNSFNIKDWMDKFFFILREVNVNKFIEIFNKIKEDRAILNRFSTLLLDISRNQICNLINNLKVEVLLEALKTKGIADNFILFLKHLKKDISKIVIPWESFFAYDWETSVYKKMANIVDKIDNHNFSKKTLQLSNTYWPYALFTLASNIEEKIIIQYINWEKRGFLKWEYSLVDLYDDKLNSNEFIKNPIVWPIW